MKTFTFDVMLNGRFVCTLKYKYCALFTIDFKDLTKFVLKKRPTLKGKDFRNVFLDNLWYRFVGNNNEIFISKQYRDYINVLLKLGLKQLYYKSFKEKEITKYECN